MDNSSQTKRLPPAKFLTIAVNLLHTALLKPERAEAKRVFRDLQQGKVVPLTHLEFEDKARVPFDLDLNYELYQGKLNFRSFRTGVELLLANAVVTLEDPDTLKVYQQEDRPRSVIFGVLAVTAVDGKPSVLVLGADSGAANGSVRLSLTYLDSVQFEENAVTDDTEST